MGKERPITELISLELQRSRAEEVLRKSREEYIDVANLTGDIIVKVDKEGRWTFLNEHACKFWSKPKEKLLGCKFVDYLNSDDVEKTKVVIQKMIKTKKVVRGVINRQKTPKGWRTVEWNGAPIFDETGNYAGLQATGRDITERKRAEERIRISLEEKELLLREIHHRVKNNMQIIYSLLNLQARYIKEKGVQNMLRDSQNRIKSMAIIHEKLYQSKDLASIKFDSYIRKLASELYHSYRVNPDAIKLKIKTDPISLGITAAIPCGLILNELLSNSLKHAFPDGKEGEINIALHTSKGKEIELAVGDNGLGIPEDLDFRNTESLGLQLINMLVEQLNGTFELDRKGGTAFKITFKGLKDKDKA